MIAVQIEHWSLGSGGARKIIAAMVIANQGLDESGVTFRYAGELHHLAVPELGISAGEQSVEVVGHDCRAGIWKLIHRVLSAALVDHRGDREVPIRTDDPGDGAP